MFFDFSFHFCFDLPQVSNCYADWGLITAAGEAYDGGRGADRERLMTADGGLFVCVSFFFSFMKAILSFFDFWTLTFWKVNASLISRVPKS